MARWIGYLAPGLPQILEGKVLRGGGLLALWTGLVGLALTRFDRVMAAASGGVDDRIALATLVLCLLAVWYGSLRDWRMPAPGDREGGDPGSGGAVRGWEAFQRNRMALLGAGILVCLYLALLLTPFLAPFGPEFRTAYQAGGDMSGILSPPSLLHPFGTDQFSQDILSRVLYGARVSLIIGLVAVGVSVTVGTFLGAVAGYWGGWVDSVLMRAVDLVMAFPRLVLLISIVALFPANFMVVVLALAFTQWPFTVRLVRGEVLSLKEREFAEAARALGFSRRRILLRHLLPNAAGPIIVMAMLGVGNAIILEAGLSFLGMGVQAGTPSWGVMVSEGRDFLTDAWWVATFPGLAIVMAVMSFNLVGDGLRDALDPRSGPEVDP